MSKSEFGGPHEMQKNPEAIPAEYTLHDDERFTIEAMADVRRRRHYFKQNFKQIPLPESSSPLKERREHELQSVIKQSSAEIDIEPLSPDESEIKINQLISQAEQVRELTPNVASLLYAKAAQRAQADGKEYQQILSLAKEYTDASKHIPKNTPSSLLSEAIILGIETKALKGKMLPEPARVAKEAGNNNKLLLDYALVLTEQQREEFLRALPEEQRKRTSTLIDKQLAQLLKADMPLSEEDASQRAAIQERTTGHMKQMLKEPHERVDKHLVKQLTFTLKELGGEDSKRLLLELGQQSLGRHQDPEKHDIKISFAARIVRELSEMDQGLGGNLAMKLLAKKEVPDHIFTYFCRKLIGNEYITQRVDSYLAEQGNLGFLRKLIAEYPNQFNTVIDTISQIEDYQPAQHQEEIFTAICDLDSLTPIIFNRYRLADERGKKELAKNIKELKPKFFQNVPIKDILERKDRKILTEMVYLAYKPVGMSFAKVAEFIDELEDHTEDLGEYGFPQEGYPFELRGEKVFRLKQGKSIDRREGWRIRVALLMNQEQNPEKEKQQLGSLLNRLVKGGTEFSEEETKTLLSPLARDEIIERHVNGLPQDMKTDQHSYYELSGLKEILGVYFTDNYHKRLENFLSANPSIQEQLLKIWSNPDRRAVVLRKLSEDQKQKDSPSLSEKSSMVRLLSRLVGKKVLKSTKEKINANLNKFEEVSGAGSGKRVGKLKAYVSKNIGSFFAKASTGICTAADIDLYNRDDHLHINIVEDEQQVRGNNQAYIIDDNDKKSLVLRGLNPNSDFLSRISPEEYVERVFDVARQFVTDNGMKKVYLAEGLEDWHADSNREAIRNVLRKKYYKEKNKKHFRLKITGEKSINYMYEV